jgi:hypothetical protein
LWTDVVLFGDSGDGIVLVRCACFTLAAILASLFRYDRRARNAQLQIPNGGVLLSAESYIRRACTVLRTGYYCPVIGMLLLAYCMLAKQFWHLHGVHYEAARSRWHLHMSLSSAFFLQAAQDGNKLRTWQIRERIERFLMRCFPKHDDMLSLGRKKSI